LVTTGEPKYPLDPVDPAAEGFRLPLLAGEIVDQPIEKLDGVASRRGAVLREAGVCTIGDLLTRIPRRHLDRSRIVSVSEAPVGHEVTLICEVRSVTAAPPYRRGGRRLPHSVEVADETGTLRCVWFQGGRYHTFEPGDVIALSGRIEVFRGVRQVSHPEYEFVSEDGTEGLLHTGGVIPLYGSNADLKERGLRSRGFRRLVSAALQMCATHLQTQLPEGGESRHDLMSLADAFRGVHFPEDLAVAERSRRRLAFEELFLLQRELETRRRALGAQQGLAFGASQDLVPRLLRSLPFELTAAQQRCIEEIGADQAVAVPMRRLLHGDVGSGKTLVALCAALRVIEQGWQVAIMAPTEILAEQHFHNMRRLAATIGMQDVVLFKGGGRAALKRELRNGLASGATRLVVGTHALIEDDVVFARLGLAIVDEQHRFGVAQRARLSGKVVATEGAIDMLIMTATPIPRSLALTLYGDLSVSVIDELPPGRQPVRTAMRDPTRRDRIFGFVAEQVRAGRQAYVVYPLIEDSAKIDLTSATSGFEELRSQWLAGCRVELLHGRLSTEDKAAVMERFVKGEVDVLVSTTVIEVGVDVANATVMVIEHAERFGLAQLHQLRGRVGRGAQESYCILVAYPTEGDGQEWLARLEALCATSDGFALARKDLELRGPGEVLGTRQAGMPDLWVTQLLQDEDLMEPARSEAMRENRPDLEA
jgi:ATP-dependent DNA helicase RecG